MMNGKKAQGALEFLMTYGWAFLVILIMIGALAYFGVLNPTKFLPERCTFGTQFLCKDYLLATGPGATNNLILRIQNNLGSGIAVNPTPAVTNNDQFVCTTPLFYDSDGSTALTAETDGSYLVGDGDIFEVHYAGGSCIGGGFESSGGSKFKADIEIYYYDPRSGPSFSHTVKGEIFATVEEFV